MANQKRNPITTPAVRISYPAIFQPRAVRAGQEAKYSVVLMFDKKNHEHMNCLRMLYVQCQEAFQERWGAKPEQAPRVPLQGHDRSPIKDGDTARNTQGIPLVEKNPEYAGHFVVRAANISRPKIVDRNLQDILDPQVIYGGCRCKVSINAYAFDTNGNKGVTFGLNGIQFWADDDAFGATRLSAEQMFDAAGAEDPANYGGADPFASNPGQAVPAAQAPVPPVTPSLFPAAGQNAPGVRDPHDPFA